MKTCPRCQQSYDDNLNFCLNDGVELRAAVPEHLAETIAMDAPRPTAGQQATPPAWNLSAAQPPARAGKGSSKALIWVLGILGSLAVLCGGGIAGLVYLGSRIDPPAPNRSSANTANLRLDTNYNIQLPSRKGEYELTMAKYSQLKDGMDRTDVERILGGKGTELSSSTGGGMRFSVNKWEGDDYKSIILSFRNDKIMTKSQVGLDK